MLDLMKKLNSGVGFGDHLEGEILITQEVPVQAPGPRATNTNLCQAVKEAAGHFGQELRFKDGKPDSPYFLTEMICASYPKPNLT